MRAKPLGFEGFRQLGEYIVNPIRHTMCAELAIMIKLLPPKSSLKSMIVNLGFASPELSRCIEDGGKFAFP